MPEDEANGDAAQEQASGTREDVDDHEGLASESPRVAEQRPMSTTEWAMLYAG